MPKDLSICQLCKEPIWNFVCTDCISAGIRDFLPSHFHRDFLSFHSSLNRHFHVTPSTTCVQCKTKKGFALCPYCYTTEVHGWLDGENRPLAERFLSIFSFGFGDEALGQFSNPADVSIAPQEFGICDDCGEYGDELVSLDGEWICRECATDW